MARFELKGPDGVRYEVTAPDGATDADVFNVFQGSVGQSDPLDALDYSKSWEELRPEIANLPRALQQKARRRKARVAVKEEREKYRTEGLGGVELPLGLGKLSDYGISGQPGPNFAEGIPIVGGLLDEGYAAAEQGLHTISGGHIGQPYSEALATHRERSLQADEAAPVTSTAGKVVAGIGNPQGAAMALGRLFSSPTTVGQVGRGLTFGGGLGAFEGFTRGEDGNRLEKAEEGATFGAALGGFIPIAGAGAQRLYGAYQNNISPHITRARFGPEAAAEEIMANKIYASGMSPQAVRHDLAQGQRAGTMHGGGAGRSQAEVPDMIADTSDSMQRLTGAVYRAGGEAGDTVRGALNARQTGSNAFTRGAPDAGAEMTRGGGQMRRLFDAARRALLVRSRDGARATERQIIAEQRQTGRQLYDDAYQNDQAFDLSGSLTRMGLITADHTGTHRQTLQRAVDLFVRPGGTGFNQVSTVRAFDAAKKQLDDMIETAGRQGQNNLQRQLVEFKNNLLDDVHANGANPIYRQAREAWGSAAENREAIEMGRRALREDAEVTIEDFMALSQGQQQLFRIGFVDAIRRAMSGKQPTQDVTRIFENFRSQQLMNAIIPRPRADTALFADRAQRFGDVLNRSSREVQTRNVALGNSATAQRLQDDAELAGQTMQSIWNRFRASPGVLNMAFEAVGYTIGRVFSYKQDVALALAQRLVTTDRATQNAILRRLLARGGPDRFSHFTQRVQEIQGVLASQAPRIGAEAQRTPIEHQ